MVRKLYNEHYLFIYIDLFFNLVDSLFSIHKHNKYGKIENEHIKHLFLEFHNPIYSNYKFQKFLAQNKLNRNIKDNIIGYFKKITIIIGIY